MLSEIGISRAAPELRGFIVDFSFSFPMICVFWNDEILFNLMSDNFDLSTEMSKISHKILENVNNEAWL